MAFLLILGSLVAAVLLAGFLYQLRGRHRDKVRWPAPGRMIDIGGGSRLHVYELGSASGPTIILEAGLGASSLNWRYLQNVLTPFARVVAYDRAGLGWSDKCASERTPFNLTVELKSLLEAAGIEPPYILVGHSFGSFVVRRFADLYREDVAGIVLLDPLQPDHWSPASAERQPTLARGIRLARYGAWLARFGVIRFVSFLLLHGARVLPRPIDPKTGERRTHPVGRVAEQVAKMPREVWPIVAAHWSNPQFHKTAVQYLRSLPASCAEIANSAPLVDVPVVVITGAKNEPKDYALVRAIAPDALHIRAMHSGHWVHLDEPDLVAGVIQDMIEATSEEWKSSIVLRHARGV